MKKLGLDSVRYGVFRKIGKKARGRHVDFHPLATIIAEYTKDSDPDFSAEPATILKQTLDYAPDTQTVSGSGELNQAGAITVTLTDPDTGAVLFSDYLTTTTSAPFSYSYSVPLATVPAVISASFIPEDNAGNQGEELIALIDTFFPSFTFIISDESGTGYQTTTFIRDESYGTGGYYVEEPVSGTVVETNGDVVQISTGLSTDLEVTGGIVIDTGGSGGNDNGSGGNSDDSGSGGTDDGSGQSGNSGDDEDPYANLADLPGVPVAIVTAGTSGGLTTISFTLTSAFDQLLCLANGACVILEDLTNRLATTRTVLADGRVRYSAQVMLVPDEIHLYSLRPIGTTSPGGSGGDTGGNTGGGDDTDGDGISDSFDNCPIINNSDQSDLDGDNIGDICDPDVDGDLVENGLDNCPVNRNTDQTDLDGDNIGDVCDLDIYGDLVANPIDNCPIINNPNQSDLDGDNTGDACDLDIDGDLIDNGLDNCPLISNADQAGLDGDNIGDACDLDIDGDLISNALDNCPIISNADQADLDSDNIGGICDPDMDGDLIDNSLDNCPTIHNADQADLDGDGTGNACDSDIDGDGWSGVDDCDDFNDQINPDAQEIGNNGIDENCNGMADDTIEGQIDSIFDIIDQIPTASLKNKNNAKTLKNKLNAIIELVNEGLAAATVQERNNLFIEALDKLENDLIAKTDGCATGATPENNDWVTDCDQQDRLYPALTQLQLWINTLF